MVSARGTVAAGFEPVREAFVANFEQHDEVGAAVAVYRDGGLVVDLWGGTKDADARQPWEEDTLQLVFSTTKGLTAASAHLLVQRGDLDLDAPVASYWPEFKAAGKESIPVRWVMCHKAGLPVLDAPLTPAEVLAWDPMVDAIAAQAPAWEPGTAHGYHHFTYGYMMGEIIRRVSGKSPGTFFRENVATLLDLEAYIGLPEELEPRVSTLSMPRPRPLDEAALAAAPPELRQAALEMASLPDDSLPKRAMQIVQPMFDFNSREVHAAEMPPANGIATARSLAKLYASFIGEVDGVRLLEPATMEAARTCQADGVDLILLTPVRWGLGFRLSSPFSPMLGEGCFGHGGAGGSLAFASPERGVTFAYVMNNMQSHVGNDPRPRNLISALEQSLTMH
ncbi:MAG: serine hydrolase domain-containing protein [Acidimicrobiia bacterium]